MVLLITGGAGFIGSRVAQQVIDNKDHVVLFDNFSPYYDPNIKRENVRGFSETLCSLVEGDICERPLLERIFENYPISAVLHLAAIPGVRPSFEHPRRYTLVNTYGTVNVLTTAQRYGVKNVVIASSSSVYGQSSQPMVETAECKPQSPYAASKRAAEVLAEPFTLGGDLKISILRFFNVYGPHGRPDMMPVRIMDSILTGKPVDLYGMGSVYRDWTYISDVVAAILSALDNPQGYEVYNIGSGVQTDIADMTDYLATLMNKPVNKNYIAAPQHEIVKTLANIGKASAKIGYTPKVELLEGLERTWAWYKDWKFNPANLPPV